MTENFYTRMLHKHLAPKYSMDEKRITYTVNELAILITAVKEVLLKDNSLVEMSPPIVVVGDIHGQYYDLLRMFNSFAHEGKDISGVFTQKYLFLGDYVDRGKRSLECVVLVFTLKILHPKKFGILRGNHECRAINKVYGFYDELLERFERDEAEVLWRNFNEVFACLPLAGLIGKKILCMHGGISPHLNCLDDIRKIPRPLEDPMVNALALDLLWADPMVDLKGYIPNHVRGVSVYFGEDIVIDCCKKLNIDLIVRAHQMMQNGYGFFCHRKLLTIFTAPKYFPDKNNKAAVLVVNKQGKCSLKLLVPCDELNTGEQVFRQDMDLTSNDDTSYQWFTRKGGSKNRNY